MKASYFLMLIIFTALTSISGCSSSDDSVNDSTNGSLNGSANGSVNDSVNDLSDSPLKDYFGSWKYVHNGEELYITSNTNLNVAEVDENLLEVYTQGQVKYLIRNGFKSINANGTLGSLTDITQLPKGIISSGISGLGGLEVVLKNIKDGNIKTFTNADSNGDFNVAGIPAGTYDVTVGNETEGIRAQVTLTDSNEDIGNFLLADSSTNNFKTELYMNNEFIYLDGNTYSGFVRVHNISNVAGIGLSYSINITDNNLKSFSFDNVLGSIPAQGYKDIPIRMSFNPFLLNQKEITVNTTIKDINYNEWNDSLYFTAYRDKLRVNFSAEQAIVRGYISLPNRKQKSINLSSGYVEVPYTMGHDYVIALANPDLSHETAYSIGFEAQAADITNFNDTGRYESENYNETNAVVINEGSNISAYLHVGDIDFYRLKMDTTADLFRKTTQALRNTAYTSSHVAITKEILKYGNIAEIDNGVLFLNGVDVGSNTYIQLDDTLQIQLTSSNNFSTTNSSTLTIGDIKSRYSVATEDL